MDEILRLLEDIARNTSGSDSVAIAVVSGGAVVAGASVSAVFSYFVTRRSVESQEKIEQQRLRVSLVTAERLRWLQDVRGRVADFYVHTDMQYSYLKRSIPEAQVQGKQAFLDQYSQEIMGQVNMISLMLNPEEPIQNSLIVALHDCQAFLEKCFRETTEHAQEFDDSGYSNIKNRVFAAASQVGMNTWAKIKDMG